MSMGFASCKSKREMYVLIYSMQSRYLIISKPDKKKTNHVCLFKFAVSRVSVRRWKCAISVRHESLRASSNISAEAEAFGL